MLSRVQTNNEESNNTANKEWMTAEILDAINGGNSRRLYIYTELYKIKNADRQQKSGMT